jgi:hypothetical protein
LENFLDTRSWLPEWFEFVAAAGVGEEADAAGGLSADTWYDVICRKMSRD